MEEKVKQKHLTHVLELNNIDVFGKRFNGYYLQKYINQHPDNHIHLDFIVNHKFSHDSDITKLFHSQSEEEFDWKIEQIEQKLNTKNQISITEDALIHHPLYQKADILHFHMYHNMHLPIEFLARIPKNKKIILDLHDTFWLTDTNIPMLQVFEYADTNNKKFLDSQRRRVLNSIDAELVIHSSYMLDLLKKSTATKNLNATVINFGIDTNVFKPLSSKKLRQKYQINPDSLVLMCRAQHEFKGLSYIIDALKQLHLEQEVTIISVSGVGLLDELKDRYNIIDFGSISDEKQMCELFNLCDIFLAPSTEESFGFMAIEAMSCGKPVIVFEGTALPTTVNAPTIGIATKKSAEALADAIKQLADDTEERLRRGKLARKYVIKNHSEDQYYENYIHLFQRISQKSFRQITQRAKDLPPKNINQFIDVIQSKQPKRTTFDYNNSHIQAQLSSYNTSLYKKTQSERKPARLRDLPIFNIFLRAKSKLSRLVKKIF